VKHILFLLLINFPAIAFCQDNIIKSGTELTLKLEKSSGKKYNYTVVSKTSFDKPITMNNDFLKATVDSGYLKVVFGKGKFGDRDATMLMIKGGMQLMLKYTAKIKVVGSNEFKATSVNPIMYTVKTIETWPYEIKEIIVGDFEEGSY
jgi:hypothetical protein